MADTRTVVIDDPAQLQGVFENVVKSVQQVDLTDVFDGPVSEKLAEIHRGYFDREAGPDGTAWPPWQFRALDAPEEHDTLNVTGELEGSLSSNGPEHVQEASSNELKWGTSSSHSFQNQEGGEFVVDEPLLSRDHRVLLRTGDTINIPKREHVGLDEVGVAELMTIIANGIVEKLSGA